MGRAKQDMELVLLLNVSRKIADTIGSALVRNIEK